MEQDRMRFVQRPGHSI